LLDEALNVSQAYYIGQADTAVSESDQPHFPLSDKALGVFALRFGDRRTRGSQGGAVEDPESIGQEIDVLPTTVGNVLQEPAARLAPLRLAAANDRLAEIGLELCELLASLIHPP